MSILAITGLIVLTVIGIDITVCAYRTIVERIRMRHHRRAHHDIAGSLESAAYWFCEDAATEQLINDLAKHICEYGVIHPDYIRRDWRERRNEVQVKQS